MEQSRSSVEAWLPMLRATGSRYLFPSRLHASPHISTRQYARLMHRWVESIGLESALYGTHSMRRTKAAQIYRKTGNLRAVPGVDGSRSERILVLQSMNASAGVNSSPCASATGLQVILPSQTLRPLRKWMSSFKAWRQPLSASCKVKGRVALLSAKVDVRATAPGILATQ